MKCMSYPSDLSDEQWEVIRPLLEYTNGYGHRRVYMIRDVINAIFYVVKTGCQWRFLPKEYPHWHTVYTYFNRLSKSGKWEYILDEINDKKRIKYGRSTSPSFVMIDSQSVKTTGKGSKGFDGGKKNQGKKENDCS